MHEKIIEMLNNEKSFKEIFKQLKCTDEEFLRALSEQQEYTFTNIIHNATNYDEETVAY